MVVPTFYTYEKSVCATGFGNFDMNQGLYSIEHYLILILRDWYAQTIPWLKATTRKETAHNGP